MVCVSVCLLINSCQIMFIQYSTHSSVPHLSHHPHKGPESEHFQRNAHQVLKEREEEEVENVFFQLWKNVTMRASEVAHYIS